MSLLSNASRNWQSPNSALDTRIAGYHVSTSIKGKCVPIVYGTKRVPGNLIWLGIWTAKPVGNKLKGGGGKGGAGAQYDYFSDVIVALCQGPIQAVGTLFVNNLKFFTSGGGSQVYVVPSGGGTYTPTFSNQIFIDAGAYVLNAYSVSVNDFGSPGSTTLSGTAPTPLTSVSGEVVSHLTLVGGGAYQYMAVPTVTVSFVGGGGSGASATCTIVLVGPNIYSVQTLTLTSPGSGYTSAPTVVFTSNGTTLGNAVATVTIAAPGSTLTEGQYYFNSSTGSYTFSAAMGGTTVQIGYIFNPVAINGETPTDGVGFAIITGDLGQSPWTYLETSAPVPASMPSGSQTATLLFPGQNIGYTETALACSQQLELGSTGVLSNLSFEIFGFGIWGGTILDAPPFLPLPVATATISGGSISAIALSSVTLPYYTVPPYVQIIGNGTGATATATLNASGQLTGITVTNAGSGYTIANIFIGPTLQTAPAGIVFDLLTNPLWGSGLLPSDIGDLTDIGSYCIANGIFLSLTCDTQRSASEYIKELLICANGEGFWSEGVLKFRTYGDTSTAGNGMLFIPQTAPVYDLDADDFIVDGPGKAGLSVERPSVRDAVNKITIEWDNRNNAYNSEPLDEYDQYAVDTYGLRPASTLKLNMVTMQPVAQIIANVQTQRSCYIRNKYKFKLGVIYALLDPMDLVTITDPELGLIKTPVRILSIEEDEKQCLQIEAEDFPWGTAKPTLNPKEVSSTFGPGYFAQPGYTNPPMFVDLPPQVTQGSQYEVGIALSGPINWGGCTIYLSTDGGNTYSSIGRQNGAATMGITTGVLSYSQDPDLTSTLAVYLGESFGALQSYTAAEWNALNSLIAVDDELMAYENVALTSAFAYNITNLRRGVYDSIVATHASGAPFCVIDNAIFDWAYSSSVVGTTVYFKFTSFNQYGQNEQSISQVVAYPYFVQGPRLPYPWNTNFAHQPGGITDPLYPFSSFSLQQTYSLNIDGSQLPGFLVNGYGTINNFSQISRPPVLALTPSPTGGSIPGGSSITIGATTVDATNLSTPMTQQTITFPVGTNTNSVLVTLAFFDPTHDQFASIYVALDPEEGWDLTTIITLPTITATITSIPTTFLQQPPDEENAGYSIQATLDVHGGVWGGVIGPCTSVGGGHCTVQVPGSTWTTNQMAGRVFSLLASQNITNPMELVNCLIVSNTADTLTLAIDLVGGTQYIFPGDVAEIRTLATSFSSTTIGDANYINGGAGQPGTGLTPNAEIGNLAFIIHGTGAGQQRLIVSNTTTVLTVGTAWNIVPDATSIFIVLNPNVQYTASASNIPVAALQSTIMMAINVNNIVQNTWVVQVLTVNSSGETSLAPFSPFREIFQPGWGDTLNVTVSGSQL